MTAKNASNPASAAMAPSAQASVSGRCPHSAARIIVSARPDDTADTMNHGSITDDAHASREVLNSKIQASTNSRNSEAAITNAAGPRRARPKRSASKNTASATMNSGRAIMSQDSSERTLNPVSMLMMFGKFPRSDMI